MYRIVLAGGGTAGHTSPLIATAEALSQQAEVELVCIGTAKGLETRVIPAAGLRLELITPVPMPRKFNMDLIKLPFRLSKAILESRRILKKEKADALVGFGGYVSIPAYIAARLSGVPIAIHEANAIPGLANRVGARWAKFTAHTFPETQLPGSELIGMPVNRKISHPKITKAEAREFFGLDPDAPTLLVSGGSQGALRLNEAVLGARTKLLDSGIQILHVLGPKNITDDDVVVTGPAGISYHPIGFIEDMAYGYAAADFMLARAGAGTVVETSISGLPCLFVPLPYGNGEQALNAKSLVEAGGGIMVDNADLTADRLLAEVLPRITDRKVLEKMAAICRGHSAADAADQLAARIIDILGKDTGHVA